MMSGDPAGDGTVSAPASLLTRALARWRGSAFVRSRVISILHLLSGNFGGVVIMMASLAIATHALGQTEFGIMAVVLSIGRVCERMLRFESWQPLVRFVAAEENAADGDRLASLYAYGFILDVSSAVVAAGLSVVVAWAAGPMFGLDRNHVYLVAIYACAIAFNWRGMASAALRLAGQFRVLAYVQLFAFTLRLLLALLLLRLGAGIGWFMTIWAGSQILDALLFNYLGLQTLRRSGIPSPLRANLGNLTERFPGFMRFAISTNLSSTLRTMTHEMDTLLVSTFAGPSAAGLYYISRRIAKVAQSAGDMIQTVIYPDLARMWTQLGKAAMGQLVLFLQATLATMALSAVGICALFGRTALDLVFGPGFADSYPMLIAQLLAVMLTLHGAPARSALLAMNRPSYVLVTSLVATICFFLAAFLLIPHYGGLGANFAHIAFGATTVVLLDFAFWHGLKNATPPAPRASATETEA